MKNQIKLIYLQIKDKRLTSQRRYKYGATNNKNGGRK